VLVICESVEIKRIKGIFDKYSKGIKDFTTAAVGNLQPLPCELHGLLKGPKIIIASLRRFLRAYSLYPIRIHYLWLYQLSSILKKNTPAKVSDY
jgi:hypothetical protein